MKNKKTKTHGFKSLARLAICLCFALVLSVNLFAPALAAETAQASDMRLQGIEGSVTAVNAGGKAVSVWENMKLYSGYSLSTGENSCAYISLDSDKLVKLDSNSQVELRKSGDKLELLLASGQLLFNVTKPLEDSESMNIRTSTMVTGIRGTSGYVQALSARSSSVTVLDGQVELTAVLSGDTETLSAGSTAFDDAEAKINIALTDMAAVPAFVIEELQRDEQLRERVETESGLPVAELIQALNQRITQEAEAAEAYRSQISQAAAALPNSVARPEGFEIPYISVQAPADNSGGSGSTTAPPTSGP